jgi:hypothetical protein
MVMLGSFLAGAASRASEIMEEERRNTQELVDASMKFWTETGIEKYKERKTKRKDLSMKFDTLSKDFSPDQIDVIAREGKIDEVLKHLETQRSRGFTIKAGDIVTFAEGYKDTGRTTDEVLDGVMGKLNDGMTLTDAIADMGGQKTGFLGQDLSGIASKRADAFAAAFGRTPNELRALATDDITIEKSPVTGTLTMLDPVAESQAREIIGGKDAGRGLLGDFEKQAVALLGGTVIENPDGSFRTTFEDERDIQLSRKLKYSSGQHYKNLVSGSDGVPPMSPNEAALETLEWLEEQVEIEKERRGPLKKGLGPNSTGQQPSTVGQYEGVTDEQDLVSRIATNISGVTDINVRDQLVRDAETALFNYYKEIRGMYGPDARDAAQNALKQILDTLD